MSSALPPWARISAEGAAILDLSLTMYPTDVVTRTAYDFTDRVAVHIDHTTPEARALVTLLPLRDGIDLSGVVSEFANALIDHRLRRDIAAETQMIRDLIVAQAFVEADLLDTSEANADVVSDPRGIVLAARLPRS